MFEEVRAILAEALQLGDRAASLNESTPLLGGLPELDSMAVVNVITTLEEHYGFIVDDDEISEETFATLGNLVKFVEAKTSQA